MDTNFVWENKIGELFMCRKRGSVGGLSSSECPLVYLDICLLQAVRKYADN